MMARTLRDLFANTASTHADRIAIVDAGDPLTYRELSARVFGFADLLPSQPGDRVAILLPNGLDFVVAYFAAIAQGAIVVPLNDGYRERELRTFLDACDVSTLVTNRAAAELCSRVQSERESSCEIVLADEIDAARRLSNPSGDSGKIDPDDPVMIQFSSGSTGPPKRIARSHRKLLFELDSLRTALAITPEDRFLGAAPFSHVNGLVRSMLTSLTSGAALHPLARFERRAAAERIERERLSVFIAVPFMFSALAGTNFRRPPDFGSLRLCISASAPMPQNANREFRERFGIHVRQLYGSTETGTISVNLEADIEDSLDSVGTPIPGVSLEVLGEDGRPVPAGETGEIAVRSRSAIDHYLGQKELTRESFRAGAFLTGDLGRLDAEGLLALVGRKKFFINKGGYKINPHEIEALLESHEKVREAVVVGVPTALGDERIKAVIVADGECTPEDLVSGLRGQIADFKIPSVFEFRESLPKSATGKVRRAMLTGPPVPPV